MTLSSLQEASQIAAQEGFCKDCSRVRGIFSRGQKCCGYGSGKGHGCNIFCCGCGSCRSGKRTIKYIGGWWFRKKYQCRKRDEEPEIALLADLSVTQNVFNELDKNSDKTLSPGEFLDGLRANLNKDFDSSYSMASDLLQSDKREDVVSLLDAAQHDEIEKSEAEEIAGLAWQEFREMDTDGDGLIQAKEFDKDLEKF